MASNVQSNGETECVYREGGGKIGRNDNSKKEGHTVWKMVRDKSDAQKCVFQTALRISPYSTCAHCAAYLRHPSRLSEWTKEDFGVDFRAASSASF